MTPVTKSITCILLPDGTLSPAPNGTFVVLLNRFAAQGNEPATGTVVWGGCVQSFVTFDISGTRIVGYTITDMSLTASVSQRSVENVMPYF